MGWEWKDCCGSGGRDELVLYNVQDDLRALRAPVSVKSITSPTDNHVIRRLCCVWNAAFRRYR